MLLRLLGIALFVLSVAFASDDGAGVYKDHCAVCHESGAARTPPQSALRRHTSANILTTLNAGIMKPQGAELTAGQKESVANWLGVKTPITSQSVVNACSGTHSEIDPRMPSWTTWGGNLSNWHFQGRAAAGIKASDTSRLKLKWAFGIPNAASVRSQSAVYGGRVFFAAETNAYSLDAATGCTYWATELNAPVRSGITVASVNGKLILFFGDEGGSLHALDANSGIALWSLHVDDPGAELTGTPVFYQGKVYAPVASLEEVFAAAPGYKCCTFRGSVQALDAASGKVLWKTYTIDQTAHDGPTLKSGAPSAGPSGAGVWSAPTIDPQTGLLYVTTGDNYSAPATDTSDAVLALSLETGKLRWKKQLRAGDVFNVSCLQPELTACPESAGLDFDFGASAVLASLPKGRRALILAQKSGALYALDPDQEGKLLWQAQMGKGGLLGGIEWGVAFDGSRLYAASSDVAFLPPKAPNSDGPPDPTKGGGLFAFRVDNGERVWMTPPPPCDSRQPCSPAQSAAVSAIPGVVFSGSLDGHIRAFSAEDGKIIWDYDTEQEFKTVNGVAAKGGSLNAAGAVIAGGTVLVNSGYSTFGEAPGNVLLAFTVDGN